MSVCHHNKTSLLKPCCYAEHVPTWFLSDSSGWKNECGVAYGYPRACGGRRSAAQVTPKGSDNCRRASSKSSGGRDTEIKQRQSLWELSWISRTAEDVRTRGHRWSLFCPRYLFFLVAQVNQTFYIHVNDVMAAVRIYSIALGLTQIIIFLT